MKTISFDKVIENNEIDTIALALVLSKTAGNNGYALTLLALKEFGETRITEAIETVVNFSCTRASDVTISAELLAELNEIENLGIDADLAELSEYRALALARQFTTSELAAQVAVKVATTAELVHREELPTWYVERYFPPVKL